MTGAQDDSIISLNGSRSLPGHIPTFSASNSEESTNFHDHMIHISEDSKLGPWAPLSVSLPTIQGSRRRVRYKHQLYKSPPILTFLSLF